MSSHSNKSSTTRRYFYRIQHTTCHEIHQHWWGMLESTKNTKRWSKLGSWRELETRWGDCVCDGVVAMAKGDIGGVALGSSKRQDKWNGDSILWLSLEIMPHGLCFVFRIPVEYLTHQQCMVWRWRAFYNWIKHAQLFASGEIAIASRYALLRSAIFMRYKVFTWWFYVLTNRYYLQFPASPLWLCPWNLVWKRVEIDSRKKRI